MANIKINLMCRGVNCSKKYYLSLEMTDCVKINFSYESGMKLKGIINEEEHHGEITKRLIPGKKAKPIVCEHNCEKKNAELNSIIVVFPNNNEATSISRDQEFCDVPIRKYKKKCVSEKLIAKAKTDKLTDRFERGTLE